MADPKVAIRLSVDGADVAGRQVEQLSSAFRSASASASAANRATIAGAAEADSAMRSLIMRAHGYGGALLTVAAAQKALAARDELAGLRARLEQLTGSAQGAGVAMQSIFDIAQRQGAGLDEVGNTYVRVGRAIQAMGGGAQETARVVETVGAALRLNNASTTEAASVMTQFGQALAKGRVNGDEFSSLMENAPTLMDAVAVSLGKTKGELFKMAEAGELTSDVFARGVLGSFDALTAAAAAMPRTVGQAVTGVTNAFKQLSSESQVLAAASKTVVTALQFVADHAGAITNLVGVGAVLAFARLAQGLYASAAASVATVVAKRAEAASWATVTAGVVANTGALAANTIASRAAAAASSGAAAATGAMNLLFGGPAGLIAALAVGAVGWLAYKAASRPDEEGQKLIDQLDAQTEALKRQNDAREAATEAGKRKQQASLDEQRARLVAQVAQANSDLDAAMSDTSGLGAGIPDAVAALNRAEQALERFDSKLKANAAERARAADAAKAELQAPARSLDALLQELPTKEKLVAEYSKHVQEIVRSTAQALDEIAKKAATSGGNLDARIEAANAAAAAVVAKSQAAIGAAKKSLNDGLRGLGQDSRAQADAIVALELASMQASIKLAQQDLSAQQDANQRAYDQQLITLAAFLDEKYRLTKDDLQRQAELKAAEIEAERKKSAVGPGAQEQKQARIVQLEAELAVLRARSSSLRTGTQEFADRATADRRRQEVEDEAAQYRAQDALNEQARQRVAQQREAALGSVAALSEANRAGNIALIRDDRARGEAQIALFREQELAKIKFLEGEPEEYARAQEAINEAVRIKHAELTESLKPEWQRMLEGWQDTAKLMKQAMDNAMTGTLKGAEDAFVSLVTTGKANLKDLVNVAIAEFARAQFRQAMAGLVKWAASAFGPSNSQGAGGDAIKNAFGDVYSSAGRLAFAAGGVVTGPTNFRFAQGGALRKGLMGEAGPEAIMPLRRAADGSLGVIAQGGGTTFNITVAGDATTNTVRMIETALAKYDRQRRQRGD